MKSYSHLVILVILAGLCAVVAEAQAPARDQSRRAAPVVGTAGISGVVTMAGSTMPAARARVNLGGTDISGRSTSTDEGGRFSFTGLPAGRYSVSASKVGYLTASYGQSRPGRAGTPIQLAEGQQFDARIQMYKGGVLTGTILDEQGEVIPSTPVRVLRWTQQSGQRVLQSAGSASTDDRGIYRAYGLQPGDYLVSASPRNTLSDMDRMRQELESIRQAQASGRMDATQARGLAERAAVIQGQLVEDGEQPTGYAPVYYPGTTAPTQAGAVTLAAGEERAGIDFQLQRVPVARIEGTVINGTGQPIPNIQVTLLPATAGFTGETTGARADAEGRFRLLNVAPGSYTLTAMGTINPGGPAQPAGAPGRGAGPAQRPEPQRFWAITDLVVDGRNIANVGLALQPGLTVTGRIAFEGAAAPPADLTRMRISLAPVNIAGTPRTIVAGASGRVDAAGRLTIANVMPGRYRLSGGGGGGWSIKSAVIDGQDALDFPLEIKQSLAGAVVTFTDRQAEISGTAIDQKGQPSTTATIVLFPADQRLWGSTSRRIRTARVATDGSFTFTTVPPGEHRLAPTIDPEPDAWFDPAFLQQLESGAIRVTIGEGEKKSVQVSTLGG